MPMRKEEKQRLEREEMEGKGFVPKLERLLLAVDESANGKFASRIAGLHRRHHAHADHRHAHQDRQQDRQGRRRMPKSEKGRSTRRARPSRNSPEPAVERGAKAADGRRPDAKLDVTTIVETIAETEAVAEEAEKGYDLMVVGAGKDRRAPQPNSTTSVTKLAAGFEGPLAVVDVRDKLLEHPLHGKLDILVPVNGTEMSRRAAEVAIAMARASKAPLTALYVAAAQRQAARNARGAYEEAILKDIVELADSYDIELRTAVRADSRRRRGHPEGTERAASTI